MSRIGKVPLDIPAGVQLTADKGAVVVKGPKGTLTLSLTEGITAKVEAGKVSIARAVSGVASPQRIL